MRTAVTLLLLAALSEAAAAHSAVGSAPDLAAGEGAAVDAATRTTRVPGSADALPDVLALVGIAVSGGAAAVMLRRPRTGAP